MVEIYLENLSIINDKPFGKIDYKVELGKTAEYIESFNPVVKRMIENIGIINSFCSYNKDEGGVMVLSDGHISYMVIFDGSIIVSETLSIDGELIAENSTISDVVQYDSWGLYEDTTTVIPKQRDILLPLLFYTDSGRKLVNNFVVVNEKTGRNYFSGNKWRFKDSGVDFIGALNKYYPLLGFNDLEVQEDGSIKKSSGQYLYYTSEGSGFLKLLNILPELDYCKKTGKILIIPNYSDQLHPLVWKGLKGLVEKLGITAIMTRVDY